MIIADISYKIYKKSQELRRNHEKNVKRLFFYHDLCYNNIVM